jgi:HEAT repeat protein/GTPase SAR1 family protein
MEIIAATLLSYLVSLAASYRYDAISKATQEKASKELLRAKNLEDIDLFSSMDAFTAELVSVSDSVIKQTRETLKLDEKHTPLLRLFEDRSFLNELAIWLVMGQQGEGEQAKTNLETRMVATLRGCGTKPELVTEFQKTFFALIERDIARNPTLEHWQHKALLRALHDKVDEIKDIVSEQAKLFTPEQLQQALIRYRDLTLERCDILDLAGLPEDDRHLATQKFVLRNFYVPLRVRVEATVLTEEDLIKLESRRESERLQAAGREKSKQENSVRVAVGERLQQNPRFVVLDDLETGKAGKTIQQEAGKTIQQNIHFVVLGDPGAGKTTLIRWLVTAYLLKMKQDIDFAQLPDVKTLPDRDWLPILIRCRELDQDSLRGDLEDMLRQTLKKAELIDDTKVLLVALKQQLKEGNTLLLIDGLDEIADPTVRIRFCQQLETVVKRYPQVTILITSRIVGYREMPFKMGRSFEHLIVTDLSKEDKDEFVRRWCETTELKDRCAQATADLIKAIHSSDRIERLTGNPMLLTTLALVQRNEHKLPTRRADLYEEAIKVLLSWRSEVDEPLDKKEALPQLGYVAYEMCQRGVQQLREDEVLVLLEEIREKHSQRKTHPLHTHSPEEFLKILKHRTSILVEVGTVKHNGLLVPVYEFRHLTFQEYLAGLALVRGHFPGHDKTKRLAERIAPLAGITVERDIGRRKEFVISENWREALRLCIANCNDDDVDEAIEAILTPLPTEDAEKITRPRAVLAVLCLADEPNVSEEVGSQVLQMFVKQVVENDGIRHVKTSLNSAAMEITRSIWAIKLQRKLAKAFCQDRSTVSYRCGNLCGMMGEEIIFALSDSSSEIKKLIEQLGCANETEVIINSLTLMNIAYSEHFPIALVSVALDKLSLLLNQSDAMAHAVAWAMGWLAIHHQKQATEWAKNEANIQTILACLKQSNFDKKVTYWLVAFVGQVKDLRAVEPLIAKLDDENEDVRSVAYDALGEIKDVRAVEPLIAKLDDENKDVRQQALGALAKITRDEIDQKLLSTHFKVRYFWLDPKEPIAHARIAEAAEALNLPPEEIQRRYEALAQQFGLKLEWQA